MRVEWCTIAVEPLGVKDLAVVVRGPGPVRDPQILRVARTLQG